ncbi:MULTISPECIES: FAD-dependent oxidoreductase [unclassified Arsukibacterium]|uniref:FAD-dependent oxidoreductase n=1 Tax=unclassified Arsukibacterium TaxID=2635278 RepID=UPI000C8F12FD|nr:MULTISPECIES: FAD-dependent oxidoreductase [unclassified Arsukibacterium]MAA95208.1 2-octaprenyl-3-methyl-6-methoxy-1,4-benzoquinol hydroxylase [Rheinheimera sp.]HAW92620.1 2-octaprenyl-3-methyl-6-methoxy-1,4-benzoquinol hydroxylase [Candidatus Azambacteria bacterium]|tara:strand:+ start:39608 stop:40789 length:1182 start_codon:yes stop_codon:yes gene_type:complete
MSSNTVQQFDISIVGGGMVGAAIALSLSQAGLQVALIEKQAPAEFDSASAPDLRVSSINLASEAWLTKLGAWQLLQQMRLCPYQRLQAFEHPASIVTFDAAEVKNSHLGHIVENNVLQLALWQQFTAKVTRFCPASVSALSQTSDNALLTLDSGEQLRSALVIAADGGNSQLRQLAGIGTSGWQYQQACLVALVNTPYPQQDVTWQQFTPTGPKAFLPLPGQQGNIVWYDNAPTVKHLATLKPEQLTRELLKAFPEQLGEVKVVSSSWFPLARMDVNRYFAGRVVLAGDAAHTINPLAGQGVNLGFADAKLLTELIISAHQQQQDIGNETLLSGYQRKRKPANLLMMSTMDGFYQLFGNDIAPLRKLRQLALTLASRSGALKKLVTHYAVGIK